jgi:hypothetical protein
MADLKQVVSDPDFMALPISEQVKGLSELDSDFGGLPPTEQVKGLKEMRTNPSMFKNFVLGFGHGISDPIQGLKQRGAEIGEALGVVSPQEAQTIQDDITKRENIYKSLSGDSTSANIGSTLGNVASTAVIPGGLGGSLLKRILTGAAGGAASGFVQPTAEDESSLNNTLWMGGIGGLGGAMFGGKRKITNAIQGNIMKPDQVVTKGANALGQAVDLTRQQIADLAKKYDINPTFGESTGSNFSKNLELIGERFPSVFGLAQYRKGVVQAADDAANRFLEQYMVNPSAAVPMQANRRFASSIYDDLKRIISGVPVQEIKPDETKAVATKLLERYPGMFDFSQDAKMKNILTQVVKGTEDLQLMDAAGNVITKPRTFTFDDLWMLREGLGDAIGQARQKMTRGDVNATQVGELRKLFGAVSRDMDNWAGSIGAPGISQTFKAANDAYRHYVVKYDILQRAYDESTVAAGKGDREYFSPQVFSKNLRNIVYKDKELKRFTSNELSEMAGLANIMQIVKRSGQFAGQQNTGIQMLTLGTPLSIGGAIGGAVGGGLGGAALGAGGVAIGAGTLKFLTATKPGKALLMSASHIEPNSYTAKMLINTIERQAPRAIGFYPQGGTE